MIRRVVSAALLVRDGLTGIPFASGASMRCVLDGRSFRPLWKQGGYLILTDLEPGEHQLLLSCRSYREQAFTFSADEQIWEQEIDMEPAENYPFPADAALLHLTLKEKGKPVAAETVWAAAPDRMVSLRLGQAPQKDSPEVRILCRGSITWLRLPGWFLAADEGKSGPELVRLMDVQGEKGILKSPMEMSHPRSTELLRARRFVTDADGRLEASFRSGEKVFFFREGQWKAFELKAGIQELEWKES